MTPGQISRLCDPKHCDDLAALHKTVLELHALVVLTRDAIVVKCGKKKAAAVGNLVEVAIQKGVLKTIVDTEIAAAKAQGAANAPRVVLTDTQGRPK